MELHEHRLDVWRQILRFRYISIAALGVLAMLPVAGPHHWIVAAILLVLVLPFNLLNDVWLRSTGRLRPFIPFTDQLLVVAVVALEPSLLSIGLVVLVAVNATNAVGFGRKVAYPAGALGAAGMLLIAGFQGKAEDLLQVAVFIVCSTFSITVAGSISETEQDIQSKYAELMSGIDVIVWEQITVRPSTLFVNRQAVNVLGFPANRWREPGFWRSHVHPDDVDAAARAYRDNIRRGQSTELEYRMLAADGRVLHMHDRMSVETDSFGQATSVRGVMLDVTAEREAHAQADQYVNVVESIRVALFVFGLRDVNDDDSLGLLAINPAAAAVSGATVEGSVGRLASETLDLPQTDVLIADLADVVRTGGSFVRESFRVDAEGEDDGDTNGRVYTAYAFALPGNAVALSLDDVTERAMAAEVLRRQALHDGLTGLPNRTSLNDRLRAALRVSKIASRPVGLLIMDLDQFKEVNDALGHDHGDRLLIEISRRLQRVLPDADLIARLGGDEFAVLLSDCSEERAVAAAEVVRQTFEQPFQLSGITLQTNASIGIALSPAHAIDAEALAQKADVAMYAAKRGGLGWSLYAPEHDQSSVRRLALLAELRTAINSDQLVLHYQPTLGLAEGRVEAVEALVRWQHPEHGLMAPVEFIELAELSGMIQGLTRWVLEARPPADPGVERPRPRAAGVGQPLRAEPLRPRAGALAQRAARRAWRCGVPAQVGDHGEPAHGRPDARHGGPREDEEPRRVDEHRRLRHGLLVAGVPQEPAHRRAEDRPLVRGQHGPGRRRPDDRAVDDRAEPQPRAGRRGRGRGGRHHAAPPGRDGLRPRPGVPDQPARDGGRARAVARRRGGPAHGPASARPWVNRSRTSAAERRPPNVIPAPVSRVGSPAGDVAAALLGARLAALHAGRVERARDAVRGLGPPVGEHEAVVAELVEAGTTGARGGLGRMGVAVRHDGGPSCSGVVIGWATPAAHHGTWSAPPTGVRMVGAGRQRAVSCTGWRRAPVRRQRTFATGYGFCLVAPMGSPAQFHRA